MKIINQVLLRFTARNDARTNETNIIMVLNKLAQ